MVQAGAGADQFDEPVLVVEGEPAQGHARGARRVTGQGRRHSRSFAFVVVRHEWNGIAAGVPAVVIPGSLAHGELADLPVFGGPGVDDGLDDVLGRPGLQ